MISYKDKLWFNNGDIVVPISYAKKGNIMDNYIVINGKKAELTEEQLKQLGIETKKKRNNPFNSELKNMDIFYSIGPLDVFEQYYISSLMENGIKLANNFNDKDFANQVYLHELLNRKLLKYAWDNNAEDREWDNQNPHYYIRRHLVSNLFYIQQNILSKNCGTIYFSAEEVAEQAIEDVVEPFIAEHPEFVW